MSRRCDAHLYKRIKREKSTLYKCQRCPHYISEDLVIGRAAECWRCHRTFSMNFHSLLLKPHCGCMIGSRSTSNDNLKEAKEAIYDSLIKKLG